MRLPSFYHLPLVLFEAFQLLIVMEITFVFLFQSYFQCHSFDGHLFVRLEMLHDVLLELLHIGCLGTSSNGRESAKLGSAAIDILEIL